MGTDVRYADEPGLLSLYSATAVGEIAPSYLGSGSQSLTATLSGLSVPCRCHSRVHNR